MMSWCQRTSRVSTHWWWRTPGAAINVDSARSGKSGVRAKAAASQQIRCSHHHPAGALVLASSRGAAPHWAAWRSNQ